MYPNIFYLILILFLLFFPHKAYGSGKIIEQSALLKSDITVNITDPRIEILKNYLSKHNSPLSEHSQYIINISDAYRIPWYLIVAISGVESTFCKHIPFNSYNCWGWNNGNTHFNNFEDAIYHIAKGLKNGYFDRNLTDPYSIGPIYAPPSKTWATKVVNFSNQILSFTDNPHSPNFSL